MSSEATAARKEGFAELLRTNGEDLIIRNSVVRGIVNRGLAASAIARGEMEFGERTDTVAEWLICVMESPPRVGEYFEDEYGDHHRIKVVRRTDITWRLDCEPTSPESDE